MVRRASTNSTAPSTVLLAALGSLLVALTLLVAPPRAAAAETYSGTMSQAVSSLTVAPEVRTGYNRDLFPHWVDADRDGCDTRREVLISESQTNVTVGSGCSLSGGRWYSYYDRATWTDPADVDIDHLVPLAEAWDSGARSWTTATRQAFANDLGDGRSLIAVTDSVNQAKGDQDPTDWMPQFDRCRYAREWVAVKVRWRLTIDSAERSTLSSLASSCGGTITVQRAR